MYREKEQADWRRASPMIAILYNANKRSDAEPMAMDALVPFKTKRVEDVPHIPFRELLPLIMKAKP